MLSRIFIISLLCSSFLINPFVQTSSFKKTFLQKLRQNNTPNTANLIRKIELRSGFTDDYIHLSQLVCEDKDGNNITVGKPVTTSPPLNSQTTGSHITDGQEIPRNYPDIYHSKRQGNVAVVIDLQGDYEVPKCTFYNRKDCCGMKIKGAVLYGINSDNQRRTFHLFDTWTLKQSFEMVELSLAQYITIQAPWTGDHYLQISQITCENENGEIVTLGANITASPSFLTATADYAIDGVTDPRPFPQIYHSAKKTGAFFTLDLQSEHKISKCTYVNRKDCCQEKIKGSHLILKNAKKQITNKKEFTSNGLIQTFDLTK